MMSFNIHENNFSWCNSCVCVFFLSERRRLAAKEPKVSEPFFMIIIQQILIVIFASSCQLVFDWTSWWPLGSLWCQLSFTLWVNTLLSPVGLKLGCLLYRWKETSQNSLRMPNHQGEFWKHSDSCQKLPSLLASCSFIECYKSHDSSGEQFI